MANLVDEQYHKMVDTPVSKLVVTLGIPTTISMLITNLYNMVDTYFVSQISLTASGATGIVFTLMALFQAFGFCFGHGAGSNISRQLGSKKVDLAKTYASTAFVLALVVGVMIAVLGLTFETRLLYLLGSTDTILNDAKAYGTFILIAGPAFTISCVLNNILRYEGKAIFSMFGLGAGAILNMILDPILIFGFKMGTWGAGLSTAISQYISMIILMMPYLTGKTVVKLKFSLFTKDFSDIQNIFLTGCPSLARQGLNALGTTILNNQAAMYGDGAIAAMSIVSRCGNLLFSTALGITQGFQPVCAYNYGAKQYKRVYDAFYFTLSFGVCMIIGFSVLCYFNAAWIVQLFRKDPLVIQAGVEALRYSCLFIFTLPISSVVSMMFQSTGNKGKAFFAAVLQNGLIFIPLIAFLPMALGLKGIELAQPLAYFIAALITYPMGHVYLKELKLKGI